MSLWYKVETEGLTKSLSLSADLAVAWLVAGSDGDSIAESVAVSVAEAVAVSVTGAVAVSFVVPVSVAKAVPESVAEFDAEVPTPAPG